MAPVQERDTVTILGIPVDRVTMTETLSRLEQFIGEKTPHVIVTADSSGLYTQQSDATLKKIMLEADLVTPDSFGVIWAARRAGKPIDARVNGVEIVELLCELSAKKGFRIFFLGAAPGVAEMAAERLKLKYPGCNIVGTRNGYFPSSDDSLVAESIAELKPDVLFVAMGIPRQEKFIAETKDIIKASVAIGVGGSFDVYAGKAKRAPLIIQRLNLEWAWRLILNPSKISKCATLPKFALAIVRQPQTEKK